MRFKLKSKIIGLAALAALIPVVTMLVLTSVQEAKLSKKVGEELYLLAKDNIARLAQDAYRTCTTTNDMLEKQLKDGMDAALKILAKQGEITMSEKLISWSVYSGSDKKERKSVKLPKMLFNDKWFGKIISFDTQAPIVDTVQRLSGVDCSIYQRMGSDGDMVRIATTIALDDNMRAIGEYFPFSEPTGQNKIMESVLAGDRYTGPSLDNANLQASYLPLYDINSMVVGMLEVRTKIDPLSAVRSSILSTKVGRSGYVWVVGTTGKNKGHYIISKNGEYDGKNIIEAQDGRGRYVVKDIMDLALKSNPDEINYYRYLWRDSEDDEYQTKVSGFLYFKPWGWIIGAGMYKNDFSTAQIKVHDIMGSFSRYVIIGGVFILAFVIMFSFYLGSKIAGPISKMAMIASKIADGDIASAAKSLAEMDSACFKGQDINKSPGTLDETGRLYHDMREMTLNLNSLVGQVQKSGIQVTSAVTRISALARQLESTVHRQASSTNEVNATTKEITATARELLGTVDHVSVLATDTEDLVQEGQNNITDMTEVMNGMLMGTEAISEHLVQINERAMEIVGIITTITKVADQTNLLSLNAAIEAEKAGEFGHGFSVVAKEIRRLADQTAVATLDIESMVKEMLQAVESGVRDMDRFSEDVAHGEHRTSDLSQRLKSIMDHISDLNPRFMLVHEGMHQQAEGAEQINQAMNMLSESASGTTEVVDEFHSAADKLSEAIKALQREVSKFKVN